MSVREWVDSIEVSPWHTILINQNNTEVLMVHGNLIFNFITFGVAILIQMIASPNF